jgi:hypothetical protein
MKEKRKHKKQIDKDKHSLISTKLRNKIALIKMHQEKKRENEKERVRNSRDGYEVMLENLKLDTRLRDAFKAVYEKVNMDLQQTITRRVLILFIKELQRLRREGKMYKAKYICFKPSDINMEKINHLGKQGWKFAFDANEKLYFWREYILGEGE